jgi:oxygen-independent coproporphyrinogen-3 oxidase
MLSLYIHIPFCVKKCLYCGFYSTRYSAQNADRFINALRIEARSKAAAFAGQEFGTCYIGGGTPTVLSSEQLTTVIWIVRSNFAIAADAEITVEANPQSGTEPLLNALLRSGVNRLSIGIQSFSDRLLATLGRPHSAAQASEVFQSARRCGFENIGIDLIYGIPGQTDKDWAQTLDRALTLRPEHISAYGLSLDEGSSYHRRAASGSLQLADDDAVVEMYDKGVERFSAAGYFHYEISNFALPGSECRHNLNYWHRGEYLGLGPGAWSFIAPRRSHSFPDLSSYCARLEKGFLAPGEEELLGPAEASLETLMLGLRTRSGIELERIAREFGPQVRDRFLTQAAPMIGMGLLKNDAGRLSLTDRGMVLSNEVIGRLSR